MTYWKWGSYQHPNAEVNLAKMSISYKLSPRGRRMERVERMHLFGQFCEDSTADVMARINELINAYQFDYQDGGLYLDDGTPTRHVVQNGESISGSRVIHRSWDGGPDELATTRTFDIVIETTYPDDESGLISWEEAVETIGNGGPSFNIVNTFFGPVAQQTALVTAQRVMQFGSSVGYLAHVAPPPPLYPTYLHNERVRLRRGSGTMRGQIATHYPSSWFYQMTLPIPQDPIPLTR